MDAGNVQRLRGRRRGFSKALLRLSYRYPAFLQESRTLGIAEGRLQLRLLTAADDAKGDENDRENQDAALSHAPRSRLIALNCSLVISPLA